MKGMNTEHIPVEARYCLSINEAAEYSGICEKKLRQIIHDNPNADFVLLNGTKMLLKRKLFERFLDATSTV